MTDLIEIPYWIYLSLIQGAVLLALMLTIFFMKFKKSKLKIKTLETALESHTKTDDTAQLKTRIDSQELELLDQEEKGSATDTIPAPEDDSLTAAEDSDDNIINITNIISAQISLISDLNSQIAKLSVAPEEKSVLQDSITKLETQSKKILEAIEVPQDENEFLQDQIQALLKQDAQYDTKTSHQIEVLKTHLADKNKEYDELNQKFTQVEAKYLKLEEEQPKSSEN